MKKILVPTDFSKNADNAINFALKIAQNNGAEIILLHAFHAPVVDAQTPGNIMASLVKEEENKSTNLLKKKIVEIQSQPKFSKIKCQQIATLGFAVEEIIIASNDLKADLIVMGTKGASGLKEVLLGSNTARVIEKAKVPVLAIPEKAKFSSLKKIVYASDFKSDDSQLIEQLINFAKVFNTQVSILHVSPMKEKDADAKLDWLFAEVKYKVNYEKISFHILNKEKIAEGIDGFVRYSEADMLAMTTYKKGLIESVFHKSMTKKMAYHMDIPLMVFHK